VALGDPRLRLALEADVGRPLRLRRDLDGIQELAHSVLVTTEATRRALSEELGTPVDVRRFRPNVHLELDADPWVEEKWTGATTLRFADGVVLRLLHPCERCAIPTRDPATQEKWPQLLRHLAARHAQLFGINARVVRSGRIHEGEPVEVEPR
jgi:uncharacterized protein YcbX